MNNKIIIWDRNKCKTCYSCIRACPVKAIHVKQNTVYPHFEDGRCTHCGHCIAACAYDAIKYYDSKEEVKEMKRRLVQHQYLSFQRSLIKQHKHELRLLQLDHSKEG